MPFQSDRVDAGQAPFLSAGIEDVRRCANLHRAQQRVLIVPRIETVRANPYRNVEIEADRQTALRCAVAAAAKLLIRDPLHVFMKSDVIAVGPAQPLQRFFVWPLPFRRPFPPRSLEAGAQMFEAGEVLE